MDLLEKKESWMPTPIELMAYIMILLFLMFSWGCTVPLQTAETIAEYPIMDGHGNVHMAKYKSGKDQQGIDAQYEIEYDATGKIILEKRFSLKVDKSGTPEAAYAALAEQQRALAEHQRSLTEMLNIILNAGKRVAPVPVPDM